MENTNNLSTMLLQVFLIAFLPSVLKTEAVVLVNSSDFTQVLQSKAFVDKTLLIRDILTAKKKIFLVTAPRQFGKSTNLNMIKEFLTLHADVYGRIDVNATFSRTIFNNTKIHKLKDICDTHFGFYPIVHLDLQAHKSVCNVTQLLAFLKFKVHNSYMEHRYLSISPKLKMHDKIYIQGWLDNVDLVVTQRTIIQGLSNLVYFLSKHFLRKVVLLIDAYDDVIIRNMLKIKESSMRDMALAVSSVISVVTSLYNIAYLYITGVSTLASLGISKIPHLEVYQFLRNHSLANYFGFREYEVGTIFGKFDLTYGMVKQVETKFRGYESESGTVIYCPTSILSFLNTFEVKAAWAEAESIENLECLLRTPQIMEQFVYLFSFKFLPANILSHSNMYLLVEWRKMFRDSTGFTNFDVMYTVLYEYGYITFVKNNEEHGNKGLIRIPNVEIAEYFFREILQTFSKTNDKHYVEQIFDNITTLVKSTVKTMQELKS